MEKIKSVLLLYKTYQKEFLIVKVMVLIIINIWLLIIFWKLIALDGLNITNNNIALTKMQTILQPVLMYLGLDILSVNTIKMLIISIIIILSNLAVLYFSQMMAFLLLGITAKYSYKAYYNYINKDTLNYYGFEKELKELTLQEKTDILTEFIKENGIKDTNLIGYLQNKISNVNIINKNELILNINNNWLDYKQQILSKIILHQKEQMDKIEIINKKAWSWETMDYWTIIKIGGGILIIAGIVIGGLYYFNSNAVKAAGEIGKKALEGSEKTSNIALEQSKESSLEVFDNNLEISKLLKNDIIITNNKLQELSKEVNEFNLKVKEQNDSMLEFATHNSIENKKFIEQVNEIQAESVSIGKKALEENIIMFKKTGELTEQTINMNKSIQNITESLINTNKVVSNLNTCIYGGTELYIDNEGEIKKEIPSLIFQLSKIKNESNLHRESLDAILNFIGVPSELSEFGTDLLNKLKEITGRENVYQRVLERENLENVEPVDNSEVRDFTQRDEDR